MDRIPGQMVYQILKFSSTSEFAAIELLSDKIRKKLIASKGGLIYILRRTFDLPNDASFDYCKMLIRFGY
jgi:hypothetical protein